jgi:diguanylate cyclase (GGDEF)-like protein
MPFAVNREAGPSMAGVLTVLGLLVLNTVAFLVSVEAVMRSGESIRRSLAWSVSIDKLREALLDAETGQRGYLVTSDENYLKPYVEALRRMPADLAAVDAFADLHGHRADVDRVVALSRDKLAEIGRVVAAHRGGGLSGSAPLVVNGRGRLIMDEIRTISSALGRDVEQQIREAGDVYQQAKAVLYVTGGIFLLMSGMLLLTVTRLWRRQAEAARARIAEAAEAAALMEERSIRDALTGLHNRRHMMDVGPRAVETARTQATGLVVAMLDVDHFKRFNDSHGHAAGDAALAFVAVGLRRWLRDGEHAFRYGGEEFAILLPDCGWEEALARMESLRLGLSTTRRDGDGTLLPPLTVSIGMASFPSHGSSFTDLLSQADEALYAAKAAGRNRVTAARLAA